MDLRECVVCELHTVYVNGFININNIFKAQCGYVIYVQLEISVEF